ncbi:MAG: hypothetical protein CTY33_02830 [Methylotenera sp.]|nr:MAG: hypothetical protein CTY33_02830 [Methylotenera sp.]
MANRPIFIPSLKDRILVNTKHVDFKWSPGMSVSQKQKSVESLHTAACETLHLEKILEVSTKSKEPLGVALSAFNLMFTTLKYNRTFTVESAYQGSKVFENGGPYNDLFEAPSRDAKTDERLQSSGRLKGFSFFGKRWGLEPQTAFYDWLYINAISKRPDLIEQLRDYSAFTDIEFNPERSFNCQAYSVALCVSLYKRNMLDRALSATEEFISIINQSAINNARHNEALQPSLGIFKEMDS